MSIMWKDIIQEFEKLRNSEKGVILSRFFKTGKGEYGEGDVFLGLTVPAQRVVAKKYSVAALEDLEKLLQSDIHEYRLTALLILVDQFNNSSGTQRKKIYDFYLKHRKYVNNWDLVDSSADDIVGGYLFGNDTSILQKLAISPGIWDRRIAIIATFYFIKKNRFDEALTIARILISDHHDLIHKAVGWMLREIGKRDLKIEEEFLQKHYKAMPRTMLRYAIERFSQAKKRFYLSKD